MSNNDILGTALKDYLKGKNKENITVISSIAEDDELPLDYLFRKANQLPKLEQKALALCYGKVLDVGAGSGTHSLILKDRGLDVLSIDISKGAVEVMKERGLNALQTDFMEFNHQQFDTILLLMNGVGIAQKLNKLTHFLNHAASLLNDGGQVLLDSSDIKYMYTEKDGSIWLNLYGEYYGEVTYQMKYKNNLSPEFSWLFVDFEKLKEHAAKASLNCELIFEDEHYGYLVRLIKS
ncbi:MAG: class I SAM-dependent methyltransferase [Flavobacteriales bacterium]|nr:class I SAM-dependent methyltransferase [Flavobacteriales bacterium]MCW8937676.1 class I SAM-dependent methyltransferase [Flavobacteriales bacterium]MCW8939640.1 class I SAM-dependent methyltransferase [Flavobacteriales bacterium]MCW8967562.1 class I SAM-dependent methyltransferase [Flavobacteriales bacterium]MCW8990164.1 class I SAM-dependent methyltransferase [Flavobacteriales bacterium]